MRRDGGGANRRGPMRAKHRTELNRSSGTAIATGIAVVSAPTVSVITPAYNTAPYVARSIRSALAQSLSDLEVIVVDDGSTDETLAIIRREAATDDRVRVISQPNG